MAVCRYVPYVSLPGIGSFAMIFMCCTYESAGPSVRDHMPADSNDVRVWQQPVCPQTYPPRTISPGVQRSFVGGVVARGVLRTPVVRVVRPYSTSPAAGRIVGCRAVVGARIQLAVRKRQGRDGQQDGCRVRYQLTPTLIARPVSVMMMSASEPPDHGIRSRTASLDGSLVSYMAQGAAASQAARIVLFR